MCPGLCQMPPTPTCRWWLLEILSIDNTYHSVYEFNVIIDHDESLLDLRAAVHRQGQTCVAYGNSCPSRINIKSLPIHQMCFRGLDNIKIHELIYEQVHNQLFFGVKNDITAPGPMYAIANQMKLAKNLRDAAYLEYTKHNTQLEELRSAASLAVAEPSGLPKSLAALSPSLASPMQTTS